MVQNNIFRNYNFILDLGADPVGYFTAASGLSAHIETINYREGVAATEGTKRADKVAYGDVTLKYGLTESRELWDWFNTAMTGELSPRHLSIILVEPSEQTKKTMEPYANSMQRRWIL
jgi:phage tail-like protein